MGHNSKNKISPVSIKKSITDALNYKEQFAIAPQQIEVQEEDYANSEGFSTLLAKLENEMYAAAKDLEFEKAAQLRDRIKKIREKVLLLMAHLI